MTTTSNLTTIDSCEAVGNWTVHNISGSAGSLSAIQTSDEEVPPVQGTYCLGFDLDIENGGYYYSISSTDYSDTHVYIWVNMTTAAGLEVQSPGSGQGGIYIIGRDSSGNYSYWHVGGSDTYFGGWTCFVAHTGTTPDTNSGTAANMAQCTGIGVGFNNLAKSKAAHNCYFDFMRVGNGGVTVTGGTSGTPLTWNDVYSGDVANSIGVVSKYNGVYFLKGPVIFGDSGGSSDCYFTDTGQVVIFESAIVDSALYSLVIEEGSGTTEFTLGAKSGSSGIQGCVVKAGGSATYSIDGSTNAPTKLQLYGSSFVGAGGGITLPATATGRESLNCTFEECGEIQPGTFIVQNFNIINADDRGIRMSTTSHNITDGNFINCPHAVHINLATTFTFDNLKFSGGNGTTIYDVENSTTGSVTINATNGSNPNESYVDNSGGGSTSISNAVNVTITVKDASNTVISDAQVRVTRDSDSSVIINTNTNASGVATNSYNYGGDAAVTIKVRKSSSADSTRYYPVRTTGTIESGGLSTTIVMQEDSIIG